MHRSPDKRFNATTTGFMKNASNELGPSFIFTSFEIKSSKNMVNSYYF